LSDLLTEIYRSHRQGLFSVALAITGSRQQAEDAVHEAFCKLVDRKPLTGDAVPYVFKTVRNSAIDIHRREQRDRTLSESLFNGYIPRAKPTDPQSELLSAERDQILRQAIDNLSDNEKEAIVLKALAGLTFQQAGEVAGIPAKTIATRYRRALETLETRLRGDT
jgi:RNA polymerase sigma factor (sigma-70 family)